MSDHASDTLPCPVCRTTLSACDWFSDAIGRLTVRCPNQHRHASGWLAHALPVVVRPVVAVRLCVCTICHIPHEWSGMGPRPEMCPECRVKQDRARSKRQATERRREQRAIVAAEIRANRDGQDVARRQTERVPCNRQAKRGATS